MRSRAELVQTIIEYLCKQVLIKHAEAEHKYKPNIVSLGSGSAEQLLKGVSKNGLVEHGAKIDLVDIDSRALKTAYNNACKMGLEPIVDINKITIVDYFEKTDPSSVDIVEMVGLADYFDDKKIEYYFRSVNRVLCKGGFLPVLIYPARKSTPMRTGWPAGRICTTVTEKSFWKC